MEEMLQYKEVQEVKNKGFKIPYQKELYEDLIVRVRKIIQDIIDSGKLDRCEINYQNSEMLLFQEIDDANVIVFYSTVSDFTHLIENNELDSTIFNFIYKLFKKTNKNMLEDESLNIDDEDWIEFVIFTSMEVIGAMDIGNLNLNLKRFEIKQGS